MSEDKNHHRSHYECVDQDQESLPGSGANTNGALFYHVEANCNGMPCPPYDAQKELNCVVRGEDELYWNQINETKQCFNLDHVAAEKYIFFLIP